MPARRDHIGLVNAEPERPAHGEADEGGAEDKEEERTADRGDLPWSAPDGSVILRFRTVAEPSQAPKRG